MELILVLVIIATLMAIAVPSLQAFYASTRADDAARHFVALCRRGQEQAIRDAMPYRMTIHANAGAYQLTRDDSTADGRVDAEWGRVFQLPAGVMMLLPHARSADVDADGAVVVAFLPDGRTQPIDVAFVAGRDGVVVTRDSATSRFQVHTMMEHDEADFATVRR